MRAKKLSFGARAAFLIFAVTLLVTSTWAAAQETVLHSFNGTHGADPFGGLILDAHGALYGTTTSGGSGTCSGGCGVVFELKPTVGGHWASKVLHNFNNSGKDGIGPTAGLIFDAAGDLFGTTSNGGAYAGGSVFELMAKAGGGWTKKVLHSFNPNGEDGGYPFAGLILDASGDLYGTTFLGGIHNDGVVFALTPEAGGGWTEKVLHNFNNNGEDGYEPQAGLIFDAAGNLYGTTSEGGAYNAGMVFELTPKAGGGWAEKVLHNFNNNGKDGQNPFASLVFDRVGNLYGTTLLGGVSTDCTDGCGTVFGLTPRMGGGWTEEVLYSFAGGDDGYWPSAGLILDAVGNLYGTTGYGGAYDRGTVFELTATAGGSWTEKVLYTFTNAFDQGAYPFSGLISDTAGNLYGTTTEGGRYKLGAVFEITP